jgi:hypothetical protein
MRDTKYKYWRQDVLILGIEQPPNYPSECHTHTRAFFADATMYIGFQGADRVLVYRCKMRKAASIDGRTKES